jgi:hypothetical protein
MNLKLTLVLSLLIFPSITVFGQESNTPPPITEVDNTTFRVNKVSSKDKIETTNTVETVNNQNSTTTINSKNDTVTSPAQVTNTSKVIIAGSCEEILTRAEENYTDFKENQTKVDYLLAKFKVKLNQSNKSDSLNGDILMKNKASELSFMTSIIELERDYTLLLSIKCETKPDFVSLVVKVKTDEDKLNNEYKKLVATIKEVNKAL